MKTRPPCAIEGPAEAKPVPASHTVSLDLAALACLNAIACESAAELVPTMVCGLGERGSSLDEDGTDKMQGMADRGRKGPAANLRDDADRAESLLQEAIAILDAGDFDRAAAYADMARQALTEAARLRDLR